MISSRISGEIGGLMTFVELIFSIMIGVFILQNFKHGLLDNVTKVKNGQMTQEEFVKGSMGKAIGAILLIMPGFFTDILGLFLQFSLFTIVLTKVFKFKSSAVSTNNRTYSQTHYTYVNKTKGDEDVIDVEVIDDNKSIR